MGLNIQKPWNQGVEDYVRACKPGVVLWVDKPTLGLMQYVKSYGGINIARRWFDESDQWSRVTNDPVSAADYCYDELQSMYSYAWNYIDWLVGFNEYYGSDKFAQYGPSIANKVASFENRMRFNAHLGGKKYAHSSLPPGNLELADWAALVNAADGDQSMLGDALACHEYWRTPAGPTSRDSYDPAAPYLIGRFQYYNPIPQTVIVTECGFDNYANPKLGWQKCYNFGGRDPIYAGQFRDYHTLIDSIALARNITVIGGCAFIVGRDPLWISEGDGKGFDFTGIREIADVMNAWPKTHTERSQTMPPTTDPIEPMIHDIFTRQGANWNAGDAFGQYILKEAKATGKVIYPMPSKDGSWQNNTSYPGYIVAYTCPVLSYKVATGVVKERLPPF